MDKRRLLSWRFDSAAHFLAVTPDAAMAATLTTANPTAQLKETNYNTSMKKNKNAKAELLEHISGKGTVVYVQVIYISSKYIDQLETRVARGTLDEMLPVLDFEYDPGYGGQAQEGTIWFADGSWSERERDDYDGRMLWVHRLRPALPNADFDGNNL